MTGAPAGAPDAERPGLAFLPLGIAIVITLVMTVYPQISADRQGNADHLAAFLLFWSMSAGFVRGVGFIPHNRFVRLLLSSIACLLALAAATVRLAMH
jgi:predicted membrane protein